VNSSTGSRKANRKNQANRSSSKATGGKKTNRKNQANRSSGKATGSKITAADQAALLDFHNRARREVGVGKVTWSKKIARHAQEWADHLASRDLWQHRPSRTYGENIARGTGNITVVQLAQGWYDEKKRYRNRVPFRYASATGHYTQMVWRDTTEIGAGVAVSRSGMVYLVCNYNPPGNLDGGRAY